MNFLPETPASGLPACAAVPSLSSLLRTCIHSFSVLSCFPLRCPSGIPFLFFTPYNELRLCALQYTLHVQNQAVALSPVRHVPRSIPRPQTGLGWAVLALLVAGLSKAIFRWQLPRWLRGGQGRTDGGRWVQDRSLGGKLVSSYKQPLQPAQHLTKLHNINFLDCCLLRRVLSIDGQAIKLQFLVTVSTSDMGELSASIFSIVAVSLLRGWAAFLLRAANHLCRGSNPLVC